MASKHNSVQWRCLAAIIAAMVLAGTARAQQPTAQGTINATFIFQSGIALVFDSAPSGVQLSANGTSSATLNFGTIGAFLTPPAGVTQTNTSNDFTVSSPFDVRVDIGGSNSTSYTLTASLASGGLTYKIDNNTVPVAPSTLRVTTTGSYATNVQHTLSLTILNTTPAGAVGTTINFTATAN